MKYAVILFDADDTLFDFQQSETVALDRALGDVGVQGDTVTLHALYKEVNGIIWQEFEEGKISQQELKVERFRRFKKAASLDFSEEAFAHSYLMHLSKASYPYEEAYPLIEALKGRVKLGLITNGLTVVQRSRIQEAPLGKLFDVVVISEEVGMKKPQPEIFAHTLAKLHHHTKEDVLMVGDGLGTDILGGLDFGIDTCWMNPKNIRNQSTYKPHYEIQRLPELWSIIEGEK